MSQMRYCTKACHVTSPLTGSHFTCAAHLLQSLPPSNLTTKQSQKRLCSRSNSFMVSTKLRAACDRCHSQKLRCLKATGSQCCVRCLRQGANCVFSPRTVRPTRQTPRLNTAIENSDESPSSYIEAPTRPAVGQQRLNTEDELGLSYNWLDPSLDIDIDATMLATASMFDSNGSYDLEIDASPTVFSRPQQESNHQLPSPPPPAVETSPPALSVQEAVRQLADLNIALFDISARLPNRGKESPGTTNYSKNIPSADSQIAIDQILSATKKFIGIFRQLYDRIDELPNKEDAAPVAASMHQINVSHLSFDQSSSGSSINLSTNYPPKLDEGTVLLVLSCHYRLMEVHETMLLLMQSCAKNPKIPVTEEEAPVRVPQLQFGSYTSPLLMCAGSNKPLSIPNMQTHMMVIFMLASQLCEQLQDLIQKQIQHTTHSEVAHITPIDDLLDTSIGQISVSKSQPNDNSTTSASPLRFDDKALKAMWNRSRNHSELIYETRQTLIQSLYKPR